MKYFRTEMETAFLKYYYCFGHYNKFADHTGYNCQMRWLWMLEKRHDIIVSYYQNTKFDILNSEKDELELEFLMQIEKGKISLGLFPRK